MVDYCTVHHVAPHDSLQVGRFCATFQVAATDDHSQAAVMSKRLSRAMSLLRDACTPESDLGHAPLYSRFHFNRIASFRSRAAGQHLVTKEACCVMKRDVPSGQTKDLALTQRSGDQIAHANVHDLRLQGSVRRDSSRALGPVRYQRHIIRVRIVEADSAGLHAGCRHYWPLTAYPPPAHLIDCSSTTHTRTGPSSQESRKVSMNALLIQFEQDSTAGSDGWNAVRALGSGRPEYSWRDSFHHVFHIGTNLSNERRLRNALSRP